jgi:hypothetical protein
MSEITGYRKLSAREIETVNEIKQTAIVVGELIEKLSHTITAGIGGSSPAFLPDQRWVSIARTTLQQGFMAATRAVTKPETF